MKRITINEKHNKKTGRDWRKKFKREMIEHFPDGSFNHSIALRLGKHSFKNPESEYPD